MKIETIQKSNYLITDTKDGDLIPVGGDDTRETPNAYLINDIDSMHLFKTRYEAFHNGLNTTTNRPGLQSYLDHFGINCPLDVYEQSLAFMMTLQKCYPDLSPDLKAREKSFEKNTPLLSEQFEANRPACTELSTLAMQCLASSGSSCSILIGEAIWHKDEEFADPHTFVMINYEKQHYVFDVGQDLRDSAGGRMPSLYFMPDSQHDILIKSKASSPYCLVECQPLLGQNTRYFGYGRKGAILSGGVHSLVPEIAEPQLKSPSF